MAHETVRLAEYAAGLHYEDLPQEVVQRAKDCITDTVAVIVQGSTLPWSRIVVRYAQRTGAGGQSRILGADGRSIQAPAAALANGALAHAFEFGQSDQTRRRRASWRDVAAAGACYRAGTWQQRS